MNIKELLVIPTIAEIKEYTELCKTYNCGFEFNDFFLPGPMDTKGFIDERCKLYEELDIPSLRTSHGEFLDVTIFSDDARIRAVSDERVEESILVARRLKCKGVVFHTNYIANFKNKPYQDNWVSRNESYFRAKCEKYKDIEIYVENMFDDEPDLLASLGERLKDVSNFGVCFDYAHAHVFGKPEQIDNWVKKLAPYVKHIHINDNCFVTDDHFALGEGKIDWAKFKDSYEKYMSGASVLIEVSGFEKAKKSIEFLNKL